MSETFPCPVPAESRTIYRLIHTDSGVFRGAKTVVGVSKCPESQIPDILTAVHSSNGVSKRRQSYAT